MPPPHPPPPTSLMRSLTCKVAYDFFIFLQFFCSSPVMPCLALPQQAASFSVFFLFTDLFSQNILHHVTHPWRPRGRQSGRCDILGRRDSFELLLFLLKISLHPKIRIVLPSCPWVSEDERKWVGDGPPENVRRTAVNPEGPFYIPL